LAESDRAAAAQFVQANLITRTGARRPYPLPDVDATLLPSLRHLVNRRLMRIEATEQGDQIELVHDRLAAVALQRAQATQRQAEAAERLRREKEVAELEVLKQRARATEIAQESARLEQARAEDAVRAARRARRLTASVAVVSVFALAAALLAWNQSQRAGDETKRALAASEAAEAARTAAEAARRDAEYRADEALKARAVAETALKAVTEAKEELTKLANTTTGAEKARAVKATSDVTQSYEQALTAVNQLTTCPAGQRLYPQIAQGSDRAVVDAVAKALRAKGFIVPRIEQVSPEKMPTNTEVRYFRKHEIGGAELALDTLRAAGMQVSANYVAGYEDSATIRPCHYELWIGRGRGKAGS
jgi:hypothetical protein